MSGGHFDYKQYQIRDVADSVLDSIRLAEKPKPKKIHHDYWVINESTQQHSYHLYGGYIEYESYERAREHLLRDPNVREVEEEHVFPTKEKTHFIGANGELYCIHHCTYDSYPEDEEVLECNEETIKIMKDAYRVLRIAETYTQRLDWYLSADDGEEELSKKLNRDLVDVNAEIARELQWNKQSGS